MLINDYMWLRSSFINRYDSKQKPIAKIFQYETIMGGAVSRELWRIIKYTKFLNILVIFSDI
jgi:hypothetical protein